MTLLAPLMLLGLAGLLLPWIAHRRSHAPPKVIPFAGVRFLHEGEQKVRQRKTIHAWILFFLRMLLLALLVFLFAKPVCQHKSQARVFAKAHDAIILIDASRSMALHVDGRTLFEQSQEMVADLIKNMPPGSRVGLLTTDPEGPRIALTADVEQVKRRFLTWASQAQRPRLGSWSLRDSMDAALAMLEDPSSTPQGERVIYAVGDRTARGLTSLANFSHEQIVLVPIPVPSNPEAPMPEHIGIRNVSWESAPEIAPQAIRIRGVVERFAEQVDEENRRPVEVILRLDGAEVSRTSVSVALGSRQRVEFTHLLMDANRAIPASLELATQGLKTDSDVLPGDELRYFWIVGQKPIDVVLVNGAPNESRIHDELFFLTTALAKGGENQRWKLHSVSPEQLSEQLRHPDRDVRIPMDVLVLANVHVPSEEVANIIKAKVNASMGLWITAGDRIEAQRYNEQFAEILPLPFRQSMIAGTAPGQAQAQAEELAPMHHQHPMFRSWQGTTGLQNAQIRRYLLCEPKSRSSVQHSYEIALSYRNGAPALLTRQVGKGRVAVLTTTIDRDWSDLPLRPGFLPLSIHLVQYLAGTSATLADPQLLVGESWRVASDKPRYLKTPSVTDFEQKEISLVPTSQNQLIYSDTFVLGHYQLAPREDDAQPQVFSVNVDPEESNTNYVEIPAQILETHELARLQSPQWHLIAIFVMILFIGESFLRSQKRTK